MFFQAVAALLVRFKCGVRLSMYVGDCRALAPPEGVELGLLRFFGQDIDKLPETRCACYDTICISGLSMMHHVVHRPKTANGADERTWTKDLAARVSLRRNPMRDRSHVE